jgi:hypothetical protein
VCSEAEVEGVPLYKARPENDAEKAACLRELTKEEINKLVVGPKVRCPIHDVQECGRKAVDKLRSRHCVVESWSRQDGS